MGITELFNRLKNEFYYIQAKRGNLSQLAFEKVAGQLEKETDIDTLMALIRILGLSRKKQAEAIIKKYLTHENEFVKVEALHALMHGLQLNYVHIAIKFLMEDDSSDNEVLKHVSASLLTKYCLSNLGKSLDARAKSELGKDIEECISLNSDESVLIFLNKSLYELGLGPSIYNGKPFPNIDEIFFHVY